MPDVDDTEIAKITKIERIAAKNMTIYNLKLNRQPPFRLIVTDEIHFQSGDRRHEYDVEENG